MGANIPCPSLTIARPHPQYSPAHCCGGSPLVEVVAQKSDSNVLLNTINLFARDKERNVSIWDARELKTNDKAAENFLNKPNTQFPLLHFLRVQQEASHGTNIDCRHLVMASPNGVVLMDFWDAADPQNENGTMKSEKGETDAEENKNLGATAKSGSIGALIQQMADFKQTLEFGGNQNQNK